MFSLSLETLPRSTSSDSGLKARCYCYRYNLCVPGKNFWQSISLALGRLDPFAKDVGGLTPRDFAKFPVGEYVLATEWIPWRDETWVKPVTHLPVDSLANRLVGTTLSLANRQRFFGVLSNISVRHVRATRQFIGVEIFHERKSYALQRAQSPMIPYLNAAGLADALGLRIEQVFPISYDLSGIAVGDAEIIKGSIEAEIPEELTEEARMKLIVEADNGE